jgi:hypothetical protein
VPDGLTLGDLVRAAESVHMWLNEDDERSAVPLVIRNLPAAKGLRQREMMYQVRGGSRALEESASFPASTACFDVTWNFV